MTEAKLTPDERKAQRSARMKALWADPEWRAKREAQLKAQWADPEHVKKVRAGWEANREKQAASVRALKTDPEYVQRQREGVQRWHGQHEHYCTQCGEVFTGGRFALVCPTCRPRNRAWTRRMMLHLLARDGADCQLCGGVISFDIGLNPNDDQAPSVDHVVPFSKGGKAEPENFRLAHKICNTKRGNRD